MTSPIYDQLQVFYKIKKNTSNDIEELNILKDSFDLTTFSKHYRKQIMFNPDPQSLKAHYKNALDEIINKKYMANDIYRQFVAELNLVINNFPNHYMVIIPLLKDLYEYEDTETFPNNNLLQLFLD